MPLKILVIEDDRDIIDVIEYVLQDDGHTVIASTSSAILKEIGLIKPDLILLDEWLGEEHTGSDICRALKVLPATSSIPILILSAVTPIELVAQQACADGYIKKPFDIDDLSRKVKQLEQKNSFY